MNQLIGTISGELDPLRKSSKTINYELLFEEEIHMQKKTQTFYLLLLHIVR